MIIIIIIFVGAMLLGYSDGMQLVLLAKVPQARRHCFDELGLNHRTR